MAERGSGAAPAVRSSEPVVLRAGPDRTSHRRSPPGRADARLRQRAGEMNEFIEAAQQGDHSAFEKLYRLHVGNVYAVCLRLTADPTAAEVLTQDVFVRVWQKLGSYEGRGPFGAWLRRVAVNVVIEDRRAKGREARWLDQRELSEMDAQTRPIPLETAIDLERAIAALPPGARFAFVLHDVEGFRHREIAELAGVATGTIKAQLHRARMLLRGALSSSRKAVKP